MSEQVTFSQIVRDAVQTLVGVEFTVHDVEGAIKQNGRPLPVKNARTRIALELIPLAQKGVIARTFRGTGKAPNRYRVPVSPSNRQWPRLQSDFPENMIRVG